MTVSRYVYNLQLKFTCSLCASLPLTLGMTIKFKAMRIVEIVGIESELISVPTNDDDGNKREIPNDSLLSISCWTQ